MTKLVRFSYSQMKETQEELLSKLNSNIEKLTIVVTELKNVILINTKK